KSQMLPPQEIVDDEAAPGTVTLSQAAGIGEELNQYRVVKDREGRLLWERSFYTKYFPRGDIWKVSKDMKGQAPIDPNAKFPPLPPAGVDSKTWTPGQELSSIAAPTTETWISGELQPQPVAEVAPEQEWTETADAGWTDPASAEWTDTTTAEWTDPADSGWSDTTSTEWTTPTEDNGMNWAPPVDDGSWTGDTWVAPDGSAQSG
ncbi:MAG: hypothetical protein KC442_22480, partial [Thermomicrobiales bacterium]|nr:hypothetical protein [Thermomicrobiales bacterium]